MKSVKNKIHCMVEVNTSDEVWGLIRNIFTNWRAFDEQIATTLRELEN